MTADESGAFTYHLCPREYFERCDPGAPYLPESFERDGFIVACGGGSRLLVRRLQPENRRPMTARDAINGRQIAIGDRLARPHVAD